MLLANRKAVVSESVDQSYPDSFVESAVRFVLYDQMASACIALVNVLCTGEFGQGSH
ncbi:hypothetical protein OAM69_06060 [bacterium]|nr:hypothetical protein [bacterium]